MKNQTINLEDTICGIRKKTLALTAGIAIAIISPFLIRTGCHSYTLRTHLNQLNTSAEAAISHIQEARNQLDITTTQFERSAPYFTQTEKNNLTSRITDSKENYTDLRERCHHAELIVKKTGQDIVQGKELTEEEDTCIAELHPTLYLAEGKHRETLSDHIQNFMQQTRQIRTECTTRQNLRNHIVANEWTLRARLLKPINGPEMTEELRSIPLEYHALVGRTNQGVNSEKNNQHNSDPYYGMQNSLGTRLIDSSKVLRHIQKTALDKHIPQHAQKLFENALRSYRTVSGLVSLISVRYEEKHDGTLEEKKLLELLQEQSNALSPITLGDQNLSALDTLLTEMHEQQYRMVTEHTQESTTITKSVWGPHYDFWQGKLTCGFHNTTVPANHYGYKTKTITPTTSTEEHHTVGTSETPWNYAADQQVGYVLTWKPLHHDKTGIRRGFMSTPGTPMIETCTYKEE